MSNVKVGDLRSPASNHEYIYLIIEVRNSEYLLQPMYDRHIENAYTMSKIAIDNEYPVASNKLLEIL